MTGVYHMTEKYIAQLYKNPNLRKYEL